MLTILWNQAFSASSGGVWSHFRPRRNSQPAQALPKGQSRRASLGTVHAVASGKATVLSNGLISTAGHITATATANASATGMVAIQKALSVSVAATARATITGISANRYDGSASVYGAENLPDEIMALLL